VNKTLLLTVSFGTTHAETCRKNITAVENQLQEAFPGVEVRRAFTSGIIRKVLQKRGIAIDDVPTALEKAAAEGFTQVVLQPTHLLYGEEYDKMCQQAAEYQDRFSSFAIAKPLLADTGDLQDTAEALALAFPETNDTALVLMGHGTTHFVNPIYAAMQTVFRLAGRQDIFIGTVEAWPGIEEILQQLQNAGYTKVNLTPFMLVAGDHATNDMASDDPDSWKTLIEQQGIQVTALLRGLGEYPEIRQIYVRHAKDKLN
jgi:sirohydrochlorin cobaltochelatase